MKIFSLSILYFLLCSGIFGQTTGLTFSPLSGDFKAPNRGPQFWNNALWNDINNPTIPAGNGNSLNRYYRFNWVDLENTNTQGSYDFSVFDGQMNAAIDNGQMFTFGVMAFCSACSLPAFGYPTYVHNGMQAEIAANRDWQHPNGFWVPNYHSVTWRTRYIALLHAIANHIASSSHSGKTYTQALLGFDMRHYSDFGEGNGFPSPSICPTTAQITDADLMFYTDSAIAIYPNAQLTIPMSYVAPNNNYNNAVGNTGTQAAYHVLTSSNNYGRIGWRRDNIGDDGYNSYLTGTTASFNGNALLPLIMNCYQVAPVGGEPANDIVAISRCSTPMCDFHNENTLFHMDYFGNGNWPINSSTSPGWSQLTANVRAGAAEQGYRIAPTGGSMTTTLSVGSQFNLTVNWLNSGNAPNYEKWNVVYQLRNAVGATVASWTSSFNPRLFQPSTTASSISDNFLVPSIATGSNFSLYVIITDPAAYKLPLPLALTGRGADGAYLVRGGITVNPGGPPFNVNAGPDQSLAGGTTSTSLVGVLPSDSSTLIVMWGESNSAGFADNTPATPLELSSRPNLQVNDHNTGAYVNSQVSVNNEQNTFITPANQFHGMELDLANLIDSGYFATKPVYYVKIGVSGAYIRQWLHSFGTSCRASGNLWDGWIGFVDSAVSKLNQTGKKYRIVVWGSLGLNDRYGINPDCPTATTSSQFMTWMAQFVSDFKARYSRPDTKFLMTDFNNPTAQTYDWSPFFTQMQSTIPNFFSIPVTGATYKDAGVHWDYNGFKVVAKNMTLRMLNDPNIQSGIGGAYSPVWSKVSGPNNPTIVSPNSKTTSITGLINGAYTFRMTVTDSLGTSLSDDVNVTIAGGAPVGPVAIPTNSGPITLPSNAVTLDGTGSTDDNGTITTYAWTNVSGPTIPTITNASSSVATVSGLTQGVYVFKLSITDNNGLQSNNNTTVTVNPQPATGATIFTTQVPQAGTDNDHQPPVGQELGLRFRSSTSGFITGVRFYRTPGNIGTHIGELYDATGARLAQATFNGSDTSIGWHTVTFGSPVAILANTTYMVGCFSSLGFYVEDNDYFLNSGVTNPPLSAMLDSAGSGGACNAPYLYTSTAAFPTSCFRSANYWLDVTFTSNLAPNPVIVSSADTLVLPVDFVSLDGTHSTDQDGTIASYFWSQVSGPSQANIATANASTTGIVILVQGIYKFQLTVTDNLGSQGVIQKIITVLPAPPPINLCNCHVRPRGTKTIFR